MAAKCSKTCRADKYGAALWWFLIDACLPISCTDKVESCPGLDGALAWAIIHVLMPVEATTTILQNSQLLNTLVFHVILIMIPALPALLLQAPLNALSKCSRRM